MNPFQPPKKNMKIEHAPVIDYPNHPAFAGRPAAPRDAESDRLIAEIDDAYEALVSAGRPVGERLEDFDREVASRMAALESHLARRVRSQFVRSLELAFGVAQRLLRADLGARDSAAPGRNDTGKLKGKFRDALAAFRQDGYFRLEDKSLARRIWRGLPLERALLQLRKKQVPERHCVLSIHPYSPAGRAVRNMARKSGFLDFVSAYTGKPMEFYYASLDHAHSAQNWFQDCYADAGLKTSKTAYMHTDADFDIIKTMLYVQDVSERDGPFAFIPGSHRWKRSPLALAVQKGFDEISPQIFAGNTENGSYYRARFKLADSRLDLLAMPEQLRGSTHFGDDLLDGSELSDALLEAEETFIAPAGTMVIFDGSRGIHRGGLIKPGGNRWAVQLAWRVRREAPPTFWRKLRAEIRGSLSYIKYVITRLNGLRHDRFLP